MNVHISKYTPDTRYENTTHYIVTDNRDKVVAVSGQSKRDAIMIGGIYHAASGYKVAHKVWRWSRARGLKHVE